MGYGSGGMQQGYTPNPYQTGGVGPGPVPQESQQYQQQGGSGIGLGSRFKLQVTPRGFMVLAGIVVVVALLVWLLFSIFGGGGDDPNVAPPNITQPTPPVYPEYGATEVPADYLPDETPNPLDGLSLAVQPTQTPVSTPLPTFELLKKGMEGPEVEMLQIRLKYFGYLTGVADGQYGPATSDAVKKFQEGANLQVDGMAGNETLQRLYSLPFDAEEAAANPDGAPGANTEILTEKPDIPG